MELSPEISCGLKRIANTALVSDENVDVFISEISSYLENPFSNHRIAGIQKNAPRIDVLKESYSAIITFLIESIKRNLDDNSVKKVLLDHKIPDSRSDKIAKVYFDHKLSTQNALRRFNSDPPHVYDVSWRMHYCLKSSFSDLDGKCVYFITLNISGNSDDKDNAPNKTIKFACSVQQLQSFVASLRAAVRQLEGIANLAKIWAKTTRQLWHNPWELEEDDILSMPSDLQTNTHCFLKRFTIYTPERGDALGRSGHSNGGIVCYTDGSKTMDGTGAGVWRRNGIPQGMSFSLGAHTTVFQAEVFAIIACVDGLLKANTRGQRIKILSDSQAAIRAIDSPCAKSKLVEECRGLLNTLGYGNGVGARSHGCGG